MDLSTQQYKQASTRIRRITIRRIIIAVIFIIPLLMIAAYTLLVSPARFVQCSNAPIDYLVRDENSQVFPPLPGYINGNSLKLLVNGDEALPVMLDDINNATQSIQWQVMLFKPDEAGQILAGALASAARRGVAVQLSFDIRQTTSGTLIAPYPEQEQKRLTQDMDKLLEELRQAGVQVRDSAPGFQSNNPNLSQNTASIYNEMMKSVCVPIDHYDHRKILIIDGKVAVIGGMNVGREYLYQVKPDLSISASVEAAERAKNGLPEAWEKEQDVSMQVEGPAVASLVNDFNWRWETLGGTILSIGTPQPLGEVTVQVLAQRPGHAEVGAGYLNLIENAQKEIYIANPYVSYDRLLDALVAAQKRGVQVILSHPNQYNDEQISKNMFRHYRNRLISAGVELYENNMHMIHSKVMVVDGRYTLIGSFNLDYRSFKYDMEDAVLVDDPAFAKEVIDRVFSPYLQYGTRLIGTQDIPWNILDWIVQPFT